MTIALRATSLVAALVALVIWCTWIPRTVSGQNAKSTPSVTFRVQFSSGHSAAEDQSGQASVSEGGIVRIEGERLSAGDVVDGKSSWRFSATPPARGGPAGRTGTADKSILITVGSQSPSNRVELRTGAGTVSFRESEIPFGVRALFLNGRVAVVRVPAVTQITTSLDEQDYPAIATNGDTLFVAYVEFAHDDRSKEIASFRRAPENFDYLARPAGADQVKLLSYSKSRREWSLPESVSAAGADCMRVAAAVDGDGRVWVIWSENRTGNFDLYAKSRKNGRWSAERRITSNPGTDVNPVTTTDASGRVWIAWQGFRGGNLEILAAVQAGDGFTVEQTVSFSKASDWDPAIAAAPNGDVAISWDTYEKGDYDVYYRAMRMRADRIAMDVATPVAASRNFEARSSVAYDPQGKLWVAYEAADVKWGKDFGQYQLDGVSLYASQTVRIKVFDGANAFTTSQPLDAALASAPGHTGREGAPNPTVAAVTKHGPRNSFPRLAAGPDGVIYLCFRSSPGFVTGLGNSWEEYFTWFDGSKWMPAIEVPMTGGLLDIRPALAAPDAGRATMIAVTDHRERMGRSSGGEEDASPLKPEINSDLVAAEIEGLPAPRPQALTAVAAETPAQPHPEAVTERAAIETLENYRTRRAGKPLQLMRGEFHRHTEYSLDGGADGPLIDAYRYLIDAAQMDWGGCCDHDNGGGREYAWWTQQKLTDAYLLGDRFVPLFSYERSVRYPEGHRNVVFERRGVRVLPRLPKVPDEAPVAPAPDTQMLYRYLRKFNGIVASHTSATGMGTDWRDNDPLLEPIVEIYQGDRQNYEMLGAPRAPAENDSNGGWKPLGMISRALGMGYRLGFEASSDHVSTHMSYANLWVENRSRAGIMEAFRSRHLYGSTDNILADVRCGDHIMGDEFSVPEPPSIEVKLTGTAEFARVYIVKDGQYVYALRPGTKTASFTWKDLGARRGTTSYYYVRGEQVDGQLVWASPMWITYR